MVVYTNVGCPVVLADAGSSGSEGVVYDVVDDPCSVAKIYHADDPDMFIHEVKVEAMTRCHLALCDKAPTPWRLSPGLPRRSIEIRPLRSSRAS